ncbi:MAG: phytoene/squalene synthase family protein [Planctomycetota bacterium]|nr:MAG: phytoene/squalene synthase family protein [Planctomycetota bacterium]
MSKKTSIQRHVKASYLHCRQITWARAKNFAFAFLFLPPQKRRSLYAVYAFARYVDDIVDNEGLPTERRKSLLQLCRQQLHNLPKAAQTQRAFYPALWDTLQRYPIPLTYLFELIEGMEQDLWKRRYETFSQLHRYCYLAASTVGLICLEIFGYHSPKAKEYGKNLGIAMQLTNVLRDIKEDWQRKRIYLPQEDLQRFQVKEEELGARKVNENLKQLLAFEASRAQEYFDRASPLVEYVKADCRFCPQTLRELYTRLLKRIRQLDYDVLQNRVRLSIWEKIGLATWVWLKTQLFKK